MRVAVVGLGKLGAPLAAVLASKGNDVLGIDVNPDGVRLLNDGRAPVEEPGLQALVSASRERLERNDRRSSAAAERERDDPARPDAVRRARRLLERVPARRARRGRARARRARRLPRRRRREHRDAGLVRGETRGPRSSVLRAGGSARRSASATAPSSSRSGNVIRDMLEPDMVLIGESDPRAGDVLERLYAGVCENDPPFRRMSLVNAELTKIAVNTYVTMKISYANTLADMCERLPGADVETVTDALGLDTPNRAEVPARRDRLRRAVLPARQQGVRRARARSRRRAAARRGDRRRQRRPDRTPRADRPVAPAETATPSGSSGSRTSPTPASIEESPGVALAATPRPEAGYEVNVLRPGRDRRGAPASSAGRARRAASVAELLERSDVVVIATPWPEFAEPADRRARQRKERAARRDRLLAAALRRGLRRRDRDRAARPGARGESARV